MRVWSGTAYELSVRRFLMVEDYDVLVVGGLAVDLRRAKRTGWLVGTSLDGCLVVWEDA